MIRCEEVKCPICGRIRDGCLIAEDGKACICVRTPSEKRCGAAGWLHQIDIDPEQIKTGKFRKRRKRPINWERLMALYQTDINSYSNIPWRDLYTGWDGESYCVPSYTGEGHICGIMRVSQDLKTRRWIDGSRVGIFCNRFTYTYNDPYVVITEGISDTDTANMLRMRALGRASCTQSTEDIVKYLQNHTHAISIIIADNDNLKPGNPGVTGAQQLLKELQDRNLPSMVIIPPGDGWDFTDWVREHGERRVRCYIKSMAKRELKRIEEKRRKEQEVHDIFMDPFDVPSPKCVGVSTGCNYYMDDPDSTTEMARQMREAFYNTVILPRPIVYVYDDAYPA